MLILTRKKGESIIIGDNIEITILELTDGKIKLGIEAPKNIDINRKEIHEAIKDENKNARNNKEININSLKNLIK